MDRNAAVHIGRGQAVPSLSARRAWIEILAAGRKAVEKGASLSARRAWIEISLFCFSDLLHGGRSPQGERG